MINSDIQPGFKEFETLLMSVMRRMYERKIADAALFRLFATQAYFRALDTEGLLCGCEASSQFFSDHRKVKKDGMDRADAEYSRDSLILAMTLFDSFITDLTKFLFLLRPQAIPKDRQLK